MGRSPTPGRQPWDTLVVFNFVPLQKQAEFFLMRLSAVMFFLVSTYSFTYLFKVRLAHREYPVAILQ